MNYQYQRKTPRRDVQTLESGQLNGERRVTETSQCVVWKIEHFKARHISQVVISHDTDTVVMPTHRHTHTHTQTDTQSSCSDAAFSQAERQFLSLNKQHVKRADNRHHRRSERGGALGASAPPGDRPAMLNNLGPCPALRDGIVSILPTLF